MEKERERVRADIAQLEQASKEIRQELAGRIAFLSNTASPNEMIEKMTAIFTEHHLQVQEDFHSEQVQEAGLSKSIRDMRLWLNGVMAPAPEAKASAKEESKVEAPAKGGAGQKRHQSPAGVADHEACRRQ